MTRLEVLKTYKIYIGGQFPRTESGRYYVAKNKAGQQLANMCLCSRKDVRDAVGAARGAFGGWSGREHLIVLKYYIVLLKCWKAEEHSLLMNW